MIPVSLWMWCGLATAVGGGGVQAVTPPLLLERNVGQAHPDVVFVARGPGGAAALTADGVLLRAPNGRLVRMVLEGGNTRAPFEPQSPTGGVTHARDVPRGLAFPPAPHFQAVRRAGVWPGVDVVFHGTPDALEYDLMLSPTAQRSITLRFDGADRVDALPNGALRIQVGDAVLWHHAPRAWAGTGNRPVVSTFVKAGPLRARLRLGAPQATAVMVDPVLEWSTLVGGASPDTVAGVATAANGDLWLAGYSQSADFAPTRPGAPPVNGMDGFVMRMTPDGRTVVQATWLGGAGDQQVLGMALGDLGEPYVVGTDTSHDPLGDAFIYVCSNNCAGGHLHLEAPTAAAPCASTPPIPGPLSGCGGTALDVFRAVAVDNTGTAYVAGYTESADLSVRGSALSFPGGGREYLVASFDQDAQLLWQRYVGGAGRQEAFAVALEDTGTVLLAGTTEGPRTGTTEAASLNFNLLRLNANGTIPSGVFTLSFGGLQDEEARTMLVHNNHAYVGGLTRGTLLDGTITGTPQGLNDLAVCVVDLTLGLDVTACRTHGGARNDVARALAVDGMGRLWVGGMDTVLDDDADAVVLRWATPTLVDAAPAPLRLGDTGALDVVLALSFPAPPSTDVFAAGQAGSATFPTTVDAPRRSANALDVPDGFLVRANLDQQPVVTLEGSPVTVEGLGCFFTLRLDKPADRPITVSAALSYPTAGATAEDFSPGLMVAGTVAPGQLTGSLLVPTLDDALDEPDDEAFTVTLSAITTANATLSSTTVSAGCVIQDNDGPPQLTVTGGVAVEGMPLVFTVTLAAVSGRDVSVNVATTVTGTALPGMDFTTATLPVTIPAGMLMGTAAVATVDDPTHEPNETVDVVLQDAVNGAVGSPQGSGTIADNDPPPTMTAGNITVLESAGIAKVVVLLSAASALPGVASFSTTAGSATAQDFEFITGRPMVFAPGTTTLDVDIPIFHDLTREADETFTVTITPGMDLGGTPVVVTVTIQDDDTAPQVTVDDAMAVEGSVLTFTVRLSGNISEVPCVVPFTINPVTASAPTHFANPVTNSLTVSPPLRSAALAITTVNDAVPSGARSFTFTLGNPTGCTLGVRYVATAYIVDNDSGPVVWMEPNRGVEGDTGSSNLSLPVRSFTPNDGGPNLTVDYQTVTGTGTTATDGVDFVTVTGSTLTIPPGGNNNALVTIQGDTNAEQDETVRVRLLNPTGGTIQVAEATLVILNDDVGIPNATFQPFNPNVPEGAAAGLTIMLTGPVPTGGATIPITITGTATLPEDATISWNAGGQTGTLTPDADGGVNSINVTLPVGALAARVTLQVQQDAVHEQPETLVLSVGAGTNVAYPAPSPFVFTLLNDDPVPVVNLGAAAVTVDEGAAVFPLNLVLSNATQDATATITLRVSNMPVPLTPAQPGVDYMVNALTVPVTPGALSLPVPIRVLMDPDTEPPEQFVVAVDSVMGPLSQGLVNSTLVTIRNTNGVPPDVYFEAPSQTVLESAGLVTVRLYLTHSWPEPVSVEVAPDLTPVAVDGGTLPQATLGSDVLANTTRVTFAANNPEQTVMVAISQDTQREPDEVFVLRLQNPLVATLGAPAQLLLTIQDDDSPRQDGGTAPDAARPDAAGQPDAAGLPDAAGTPDGGAQDGGDTPDASAAGDGGPTPVDAGSGSSTSSSSSGGTGPTGPCNCRNTGGPLDPMALLLLGGCLLAARPRRPRR